MNTDTDHPDNHCPYCGWTHPVASIVALHAAKEHPQEGPRK